MSEPSVSADDPVVRELLTQWAAASEDHKKLTNLHKDYVDKLTEMQRVQEKCQKDYSRQSKTLTDVKESLRRVSEKGTNLSKGDMEALQQLKLEMANQKTNLADMQDHLPVKNNGAYLNVILGSSVNVSLLSKNEKFRYKDEYEKFKLSVTSITLVCAVLALLFHRRAMDAVFNFLLVWYYCTLTIRESILRVNGSRIKGWWILHHYVSTFTCGVVVTWPDGPAYQAFRVQFLVFSIYLSLVQLLQCQYQRGCLYRLRALGVGHSMDITVDGFHSWMFRGLKFLLPFLFFGYLFQLYNSIVLAGLIMSPIETPWQVAALSGLFLFLFVGNMWTTILVIIAKVTEKKDKPGHKERLERKYKEDADLLAAKEQKAK